MFQASPRSCVTTSDAEPELVAQPQQQGEDLAADRRVQAAHRLVGDDHLGLEGERAGDHAPAGAARRTARAGSGAQNRSAGRSPARVERLGDELVLARSSRRDPVDAQALRDRLVAPCAAGSASRSGPAGPAAPAAGRPAGRRARCRARRRRRATRPTSAAAGRASCGPGSSCRSRTRRPGRRSRRAATSRSTPSTARAAGAPCPPRTTRRSSRASSGAALPAAARRRPSRGVVLIEALLDVADVGPGRRGAVLADEQAGRRPVRAGRRAAAGRGARSGDGHRAARVEAGSRSAAPPGPAGRRAARAGRARRRVADRRERRRERRGVRVRGRR